MGSRGLRQEERNGTEKLSSCFFALNHGPCGRPYGRLAAPQHAVAGLGRPPLTHPLVGHLQGLEAKPGEFLKFPVRRSQTPRESCGPASQRLGSASLGHTWLPQGNGQTSPPPTSPTPHSPSVVKTRASQSLAPSSTSP